MAKNKPPEGGIVLNKVKPKTINQNTFIQAINNNDVIICDGPAGTGKTYLTIGIACEYLLAGKIEQILITRTIIGAGYDLGAFKGDVDEKISPYFTAQLVYLEKILGPSYKQYLNKKIFLRPLELLRGHTYDNAMIIAEEAQNMDGKQLKLFITRLGQYSKAIITGDLSQSDINPAGFRFCLNYLNGLDKLAIINFGFEDILRNERIKHIIEVFDRNGY